MRNEFKKGIKERLNPFEGVGPFEQYRVIYTVPVMVRTLVPGSITHTPVVGS